MQNCFIFYVSLSLSFFLSISLHLSSSLFLSFLCVFSRSSLTLYFSHSLAYIIYGGVGDSLCMQKNIQRQISYGKKTLFQNENHKYCNSFVIQSFTLPANLFCISSQFSTISVSINVHASLFFSLNHFNLAQNEFVLLLRTLIVCCSEKFKNIVL